MTNEIMNFRASRTMNGPFNGPGYMALETIAPMSDDPNVNLPVLAG